MYNNICQIPALISTGSLGRAGEAVWQCEGHLHIEHSGGPQGGEGVGEGGGEEG